MSEQLHIDLREYDLPPMWDGCSVTWDEEWETVFPMHICPPPKNPGCKHCGSLAQPLMQGGLRGPLRTANRDQRNQIVKEWTYQRLTAIRCPDCLRDAVVDEEWNVWDLGPEDYGFRGSYLQTTPRTGRPRSAATEPRASSTVPASQPCGAGPTNGGSTPTERSRSRELDR